MRAQNRLVPRAVTSAGSKLGFDWGRLSQIAAAATLAALVLAAGVGSLAQAQVSALVVQKSPDAASLAAILDRDGYAPVIIEFAVPNAPPGFSADANFLNELKARIAAVQDAIIADHFDSATEPRPGQGFNRALQRMDITAMIVLNITRAELEALAADPRITRIHENKVGRAGLIQSVPIVGMTGTGGAFARGATGGGRAVAVVDTGVQANHEFLAGRVVSEACFSNPAANQVSLCPNGQTSQTGAGAASPLGTQCIDGTTNLCEHGTHVAGIAAGSNTNLNAGEPSTGVGRNAQIVAVQVFHRRNLDAHCGGTGTAPCIRYYDSDLVLALNWIAQNAVNLPNGVRLVAINMSLHGGTPQATYCDTHVLKTPIDNLRAVDVGTVIISGNDGSTTGVKTPGCISTAFTVGATTKADAVANFSNMGPQVDALAPGAGILSSVANATGGTTTYTQFDGTSMAAPHVAGAFAALKSACPEIPVVADGGLNLFDTVNVYGVAVTDTRPGGSFTRWRLDATRALNRLRESGLCPVNPNTHDANGDHKSDIIWRDGSGNTALWLMNGAAVSAAGGFTVPTTWSIVGQRDLDGDGKADLLWRDTSGNTAIWFLNGTSVASTAFVGNVPPAWSVVGTGDLDGDGRGDLIWRDSSGNTAVWLMNGAAVSSSGSLGAIPTNWSVVGMLDFNFDGKADILWRDNAGNLAIWYMDGTAVASTAFVGSIPTTWSIIGTGYFYLLGPFDSGVDRPGILWRDGSGNTAIWFMNGHAVLSTGSLGNIPTAWSLPLTGDFNGDSRSDLLWRHSSGSTALWFMNGAAVSSTAFVGTIAASWVVQGTNAN